MDETGWRDSAEQAGRAIARALEATEPEAVVAELSGAGKSLDDAVREAMAASALAGTSMRRLAEIAGMAPNSIPPRLARSKSLGPYADEGSITSQGIAVARYDAASGRPPMTFQPRRKNRNDKS